MMKQNQTVLLALNARQLKVEGMNKNCNEERNLKKLCCKNISDTALRPFGNILET